MDVTRFNYSSLLYLTCTAVFTIVIEVLLLSRLSHGCIMHFVHVIFRQVQLERKLFHICKYSAI